MFSFNWTKLSRLVKSLEPVYASPTELPAAKNNSLQQQTAHAAGINATTDSFIRSTTTVARLMASFPGKHG